MKNKTYHAFTRKALLNKTPTWAKNMFRATFVLTSAITVFIAGTNLLQEGTKYELMLAIKSLDVIVYGLSKMFGIEIKDE
ncbi:hypothetical protein [uncultured Flavobacterium sp.]|uniref:hypothetical protein n=1 Tax=uncultured Flavobacterium sp. TaxID=165435 RepID=UPI0025F2A773|nr:hypothetical protein [uncultured Flavobacterium sp.]